MLSIQTQQTSTDTLILKKKKKKNISKPYALDNQNTIKLKTQMYQ